MPFSRTENFKILKIFALNGTNNKNVWIFRKYPAIIHIYNILFGALHGRRVCPKDSLLFALRILAYIRIGASMKYFTIFICREDLAFLGKITDALPCSLSVGQNLIRLICASAGLEYGAPSKQESVMYCRTADFFNFGNYHRLPHTLDRGLSGISASKQAICAEGGRKEQKGKCRGAQSNICKNVPTCMFLIIIIQNRAGKPGGRERGVRP